MIITECKKYNERKRGEKSDDAINTREYNEGEIVRGSI
jgi:hypothetical protein